jgi:hypothetical protein
MKVSFVFRKKENINLRFEFELLIELNLSTQRNIKK